MVNCNRSSPTAHAATSGGPGPPALTGRVAGGRRSPTGARRGTTPLWPVASYSPEYEGSRTFIAWGDQGPVAHPTRSPARPRTLPSSPNSPGFVQFFVDVFSASNFPEFPPEVENCHFAELPEVPTVTADLTNGIPGRSRTRTATVPKLARSPRRLRHFRVVHSF